MTFNFWTPSEMGILIAKAAQEKRLSLNLSQKSLSDQSGVSLSVLKKFERTGKISLESLLKLSSSLGTLAEFTELFRKPSSANLPSLDALLNQKTRKRGRT